MNLDLTGKTAFVSGSTTGIGWATALSLAKLNAIVYVNGRQEERVREAVTRLKAAHPTAAVRGLTADLGTATGAAKLFAELPEVDILVNNLGVYEPKSFEEITDEDWARIFDVNVISGVRLTRQYLAGMKAKGWGRIVFVSSESGVNIPPEMIHYGTTKAAQIAVVNGVARLTVGTGVTVNALLPGPTATEGVATYMKKLSAEKGLSPEETEKDFFRVFRPTSLIQRFLTEEEVANAIVYLCTPAASGTSGSAMRVEGGLLRHC